MTRSSPPSELRQTPRRARAFLTGGESFRVTPVMGTNGVNDPWAVDPRSALALTLAAQGVTFIRALDGRPFRWQSNLAVRGHEAWGIGADALYFWSEQLAYADRNYLAFSDGGQVVWTLAASGFPMRSVTFVGTPNRHDVGAVEGLRRMGMAQVIYDLDVDVIAWLGALFDRQRDRDRSFAYLGPAMKRYGLHGIGHGGVLTDPTLVRLWQTEPWIHNMRHAEAAEAS